MKNIKLSALSCLMLFASIISAGEHKSFDLNPGKIKFEPPQGWQEVKDLFGVPLTFIGPESKATNRPVINISSSNFSEFKFDEGALEKNHASYQEGRKKWLAKNHGELKEFFPYKSRELNQGKAQDHILGYRYVFGGNEFSEYSHLVKCKKNIYHFKILFLTQEEPKYRNQVDQVFKTFSCEE